MELGQGIIAFSGAITDPDGDGTIAGLRVNGNETIRLSLNGSSYVFGVDAANPFQSITATYVGASGAKRVMPISILTEGIVPGDVRGSMARQFAFYSAEKGIPAAGETSTGVPVKNVYIVEFGNIGGITAPNQGFSVIGDATTALTRPASGSFTYSGEAVGKLFDYGTNTYSETQFVGPVTITVNFATMTSNMQGHIAVSQFSDPQTLAMPFTIDLGGDAVASGAILGTSLTLTNQGSAATFAGGFQGLAFGNAALEVGGAFEVRYGTRRIVGSFVAAR